MEATHIVVLVGPTASGKTDLALELADHRRFEILGADSRQVYRRLDIGTAKPTPEQRARVPHHLIDLVEPTEEYQAWRYQADFRSILPGVADRGAVPLVVGGTGLYIQAGIDGLSTAAPSDPALRSQLQSELLDAGPAALHARLAALDPQSAARISPNDRTRIVRLLEVCLRTGIPASVHFRQHRPEALSAQVSYLGVDWPRDQLYERIQRRTTELLRHGWIEEVEGLLASGVPTDARSMQSLGYREIVELLRGRLRREDLEERILIPTRRYAKRQLTWFRSRPVHWLPAEPLTTLAKRALAWMELELSDDA